MGRVDCRRRHLPWGPVPEAGRSLASVASVPQWFIPTSARTGDRDRPDARPTLTPAMRTIDLAFGEGILPLALDDARFAARVLLPHDPPALADPAAAFAQAVER